MYRPRFPPPCRPRPPLYGNHGQPRFNGPMNPRFDGPPRMNGQQHCFQPSHPEHPGPRMMPPLSPNNIRNPHHFPEAGPGGPPPNQPFNHPPYGWGNENHTPGGFNRPNIYGSPYPFHHTRGPGPWGRFPGPRGMAPSRPIVKYDDLAQDASPVFSHRGRGGMINRKRNTHDDGDSGPKAKKQRVNKRDLPENNKYFCETCDRGFKTEEKYQEHIDGHEQCSEEGCTYKAAPKLVLQHYRWQHATGMAKKIWQRESKEDIEKWRKERKLNFPTADNIAKKQLVMNEREKRGEVLETRTFGKMRGRGRGHRGGGGRWGRMHRYEEGRRQEKDNFVRDHETSLQKGADTVNNKENVEEKRDGDPLSYILPTQRGLSDAEEDATPSQSVTSDEIQVIATGALASLASNYGDLTESDNEEEQKPTSCDNGPTTGAQNETCEETSVRPNEPEYRRERRPKKSRGKGRSKSSRAEMANPKRKSSLLEKLLAPEIRHERNVILQCVRHIVKNNFLGVKPKEMTGLKVRQMLTI